jgi:antitoxin MazE
METRIRQIVDTLYVPLPSEIVLEANLKSESVVDVAVVNGDVIVHPTVSHSYSLEQLLAGVTENNLHQEVDFGSVVGKEVW